MGVSYQLLTVSPKASTASISSAVPSSFLKAGASVSRDVLSWQMIENHLMDFLEPAEPAHQIRPTGSAESILIKSRDDGWICLAQHSVLVLLYSVFLSVSPKINIWTVT